jgi:multidrug efflux system outer membrane protein
MIRLMTVVLSALLVSACAVGPNYKRPTVPVPGQFRDTGPEQPPSPESLADVKWFDLFQDDVLKQLVNTALDQNFDLRVAAARVLQARAQLGVSRSDQ